MTFGTAIHAALCLALGMALSPFAIDAAEAQARDIIVAVPNPSAITWTPLWVAIGEGYFEDEGLNVTVQAVDGSAPVLQAMAAGQAEIGAPGPAPLLAARARGTEVVFIYNLYPKSVFGLVVREESDYQQPADLKDTTIGVGTADGAEVGFARAILSEAGLQEREDYEFLPVGDGGLATAAFQRGDVVAYAAAVSDAAIMRSRGLALREITPDEFLSFFGNGFAVMESLIEESPEVVEGFGRALVRATRFALDDANRDAVLDHTTAGNPQEGEDRDFAAALLAAVMERMTPLEQFQDEGWGYQPPEHWQIWHESALDTGTLQQPLPDLEAAYTNDFVEAWNSEGR